MKFINFIKINFKFCKRNFKKISFCFVSIISALVLFCVPVSALGTRGATINVAYDLYATNSSVREGDFSGSNWGIDFQTVPFDRKPIQPTSSTPGYYAVMYNKLTNSYEMQNKYLVTTFQILNNSFFLEKSQTYRITLTLFFKMTTTKIIETNYLKFAFWNIYETSGDPYLNFYDTSTVKWTSQYDEKLGGYVSTHTFLLRNDSGRDINPTHLRFAIRFKSTLKLWNGNSWGFADKIYIEDARFTNDIIVNPDGGRLEEFTAMSVLSETFETFVNRLNLESTLELLYTIGISAFAIGLSASFIKFGFKIFRG